MQDQPASVRRGSLWSKWDLQVHTPASICHHYPESGDEQWELFLTGLESLPAEFKAIAISDYLFLDGYSRVKAAKEEGRLENLDLILPAVELRLKAFGGTESKLRRVNAHIIFSDELDAETVEAQFFGALKPAFKLTKEVEWKGVLTRQSLEELGNKIIESVPPKEKTSFRSPLEEGFNNLTLELGDIQRALDNTRLIGRYLLAVGKTEWASIKWNSQSIADKKTIINTADFVLISAHDAAHYKKAKRGLSDAGVNDLLLDCSDAHSLSSSQDKDRLGKCLSWINAEPTFSGLQHALLDPARIYVGDRPERLLRLQREPHCFIDSVRFAKDPHSKLTEAWFDQLALPLNPGLVSIIGNPGTGKSALAESIALALSDGNLPRSKHYSFLSAHRFCEQGENKAQHFSVKLQLRDDREFSACLEEDPLSRQGPGICFLPQNYIEKLCADPQALDRFRAELDDVVFSHVPKAERLGQTSFQGLVQHHAAETKGNLERLRLELRQINSRIQKLEQQLSDDNQEKLRERYQELRRRLLSNRSLRPKEPPKPKGQSRLKKQIADARRMRDFLDKLQEDAQQRLESYTSRLATATTLREGLRHLEDDVKARVADWSQSLAELGLEESDLIKFEINHPLLDPIIGKLSIQAATLEKWLDRSRSLSLPSQRLETQEKIDSIRSKMEEPNRLHEAYKEDLKSWNDSRREIIGDARTLNTLFYFRTQLAALEVSVPQELDSEKGKRLAKAKQILNGTYSLCSTYRKIHRKAQEFVSGNPALQRLGIRFEVAVAPKALKERFFELIHRGRKGSFQGAKDGTQRISALLGKHRFSDESSALAFVEEVLDCLERDHRTAAFETRSLSDQLIEGKQADEVFDLLYGFEYLEPTYLLQMAGRDLEALSPGERGLLLLVFYLLVNTDKRPLIIDQPEGNLDNESIYKTLVPCIRAAKQVRQVIIVTHNPILAVICDSEQIIRARIDKSSGPRVSYSGGAIEDETINRWLVDVLEGTWPAFDKRKGRYIPAKEVATEVRMVYLINGAIRGSQGE